MASFYSNPKRIRLATIAFTMLLSGISISAQQLAPDMLVADMVQKQINTSAQNNFAYRYKLHKSDRKGTVDRIEIATPFGNVARTVLREGKPLSAVEDKYERDRLQEIIESASEQKRRKKAAESSRKDTVEVVSAMRTAMVYTMRPGQPQLAAFPQPQIVLDFKPNPSFDPQSTAQQALRSVEGTLWIDAKSHVLRRIEARSTKDFNILFGLAAKVYAGAKLDAEQREFAPGKTAYTKLNIEANIRELLVKNVNFRTNQEMTELQRLSDGLSLADAARMLLDMPVPR